MLKVLAPAIALLLSSHAASASDASCDAPSAQKVIVSRDDWGIAHVHGKTDADAVFGMIYAQAEDDFPRIEANYIYALGRSAEVQGEEMIWRDLRHKMFNDPEQLRKLYGESPRWLRRLMDSWASGLNFYLCAHPGVKPRLIDRFEPWMALAFSEGSIGGDIERIDVGQLQLLYANDPPAAAPPTEPPGPAEPSGSNGFAIAPSATKQGRALLLINPHTSFYFRSEMQVSSDDGLNAYGAATWGQFFIYQGFNERAGWMHTSTGADNVDEFAQTIERRGTALFYRYGSELRPVISQRIALNYRAKDGTVQVRDVKIHRTHQGPIVREAHGKWISAALMHRPLAALQQSFLRTKATDLKSFLRVANLKANSSNNTLFADAAGHVAFLMPQFTPRRNDRFDYTKPVDGTDPATDWQGLHDLAELPQVMTPPNGWIFNVNDWPYSAAGPYSPKAADYPRYLDSVGRNPRTTQAERLLTGRRDLTLETLVDLAYDPYLPAFADLLPALHHAFELAPDAGLAAALAELRRWDYRWSAESIATSLAVFYGDTLWEAVLDGARKTGRSPYEAVTDAGDALRRASFRKAVERLDTDFGRWRVAWGEINRLQRNDGATDQIFDDSKPSIAVPFTSSRWGSLASFGARRQAGTKKYYGVAGNSFVAAVEFGPRLRAVAISVGGASGDPLSAHFADQDRLFSQGKLRGVYFYPDELLAHEVRRYHPGERTLSSSSTGEQP